MANQALQLALLLVLSILHSNNASESENSNHWSHLKGGDFLLSLSKLSKRPLDLHQVRKRPDFMGNSVSIPQYMYLTELQSATIEMDKYMKKLARRFSKKILMADPKWREMMSLYWSMESLLPPDVKEKDKEVVWWM